EEEEDRSEDRERCRELELLRRLGLFRRFVGARNRRLRWSRRTGSNFLRHGASVPTRVRPLIIPRGRFGAAFVASTCAHQLQTEEGLGVGVWVLATVALLVLTYAAASRRLERFLVTPAIFFTTTGLIAGPGLGLIDLHVGGEPVKLLAESTLTLVLFSDASRISLRALKTEYAVPLRLLGIGLPLTIAFGALVGPAVVPGLTLAEALVLAVILACTDAALGQAVVTDPRLPSRVRQGLNVESGLNDGICVPIFFIAIGIAEADTKTASVHAAVTLVVEQIGYGLVG